jgi:3-oxoacyl-ACP reductase-like protein
MKAHVTNILNHHRAQPYNAGSAQDTAALVRHIYGSMHVDLDFVIPFAAVSESGVTADAITGANEVNAPIWTSDCNTLQF